MKKAFIVVAVVLAVVFGYFYQGLSPFDAATERREKISIESGLGVQQIGNLLASKKIISSALSFRLYVQWKGLAPEAGTYILKPSDSVADIVNQLQNGKTEEVSVTIPEGFTLADIDALLAKELLIEPGELLACVQTCDFSSFEDWIPTSGGIPEFGGRLEGYLFPDTYFVSVGDFVPKFFLERLMGTFYKRVVEENKQTIADSDYNLHELITMASLIEEESRKDVERPVISGILWKRHEAEWGLGVDATVRYAVNNWDSPLTHGELNNNSPYNTRKFKGMPPGPIANFSLSSFKAALNPSESDYWYYLHDRTGKIHYSKGNVEHNMKKFEYLQ